jgi:hypothetical protein
VINEVFVEGRRFPLDPTRALGKGGEADVYDLGDGRALKVFKSPDHPDYRGVPDEMRAAEQRIAAHQTKLRAFPAALPEEVVGPLALATSRTGDRVVGYAMRLVAGAEPLFRYADPAYRRTGVAAARVVGIFGALLRAVRGLHAAGVVIGDFNDGNVLVVGEGAPRLIDADSFQFGPFVCPVFTERFVDPRLCDPAASAPRLVKRYDAEADWYAFNALLLQSLLCVGPHGGIYRPKDPARRIPPGARALQRITIFHPEVQYPKPAIGYQVLPDELLHHFHAVFERDERTPFPPALLARLAFTTCATCGVEHARAVCPGCSRVRASYATRAESGAVTARGGLRCVRVFETAQTRTAVIVHACVERGELRVLHYDDGAYRREDGTIVLRGALDPSLRVRIHGGETLVGRGGELAILASGAIVARTTVDRDGTGPAFDASEHHRYWVQGGELRRDAPSAWDPGASARIGDVLSNQTRIFVGPAFGIGFYRAGLLARAFVFDAERLGINDELRLPPLAGALVEMSASLDAGRAWLFLALKHGGRVRHLCLVYSRAGELLASAEGEPGDGSWLSTLRGKCAAHGALFAATDGGVVRVEIEAGAVRKTRDFPDTEPFVDEQSQLLLGARGLYVVRAREVLELQMK